MVNENDRVIDLTFTNRFTETLPADPRTDEHRRQVVGACYSRVEPVKAAAPALIAWSAEMFERLGLELPNELDDEQRTELARVLAGNDLLPGSDPYAMCYGGHQFGNWAGQLGDGRAIALGEVETPESEHLTLQLKGAGPTPYSRTADGMAVLRSSVREFLCSEAMFHLGISTTRALSLTLTGDKVVRDMLYDGNPAAEPGAVVCRVSPAFIRFGSFEIHASRGDIDTLRTLADHTIANHFAHLPGAEAPDAATYAAWFGEVAQRTAEMITGWMRVGFVHGVMNTDNMSILGETIDYGPYGWVDDFDPSWTPNTTDKAQRRYRYGHQPQIAYWNLAQLGNALVPLVGDEIEGLQAGLDRYVSTYAEGYRAMMLAKLGLSTERSDEDADGLIDELIRVLQLTETDYTIFFRRLADMPAGGQGRTDAELIESLSDAFYAPGDVDGEAGAAIALWLRRYFDEVADDALPDTERRTAMNAVNPKYVLRNYMAQLAIDASESGDHSVIAELLDVLRRPYDDQPEAEQWAVKRPDWARTRVGCSMLSCSS